MFERVVIGKESYHQFLESVDADPRNERHKFVGEVKALRTGEESTQELLQRGRGAALRWK